MAFAQETMLSCVMDNKDKVTVIFGESTDISSLVLKDTSVSGTTKVTEHHYSFIYPKTKGRYETHITVNRYTGELTWEHGAKPFGGASANNIFRKGKCNKANAKKSL